MGGKDMNEDFLIRKLEQRKASNALRSLLTAKEGIDLCSNDYLGIVKNKLIENRIADFSDNKRLSGSTGSRLISGNYPLIEETEKEIAQFHNAQAALIFNSGYDANSGLLSCVPQRGDTLLYDYLSHASLRDGARLSLARSFSFAHNDLGDLERKLKSAGGNIFVVTESVFSMDGDIAPLKEMVELCQRYGALLIVDEAHATGVIGIRGEGVCKALGLEDQCFARIYTFGKALGCHGAAVAGSATLYDYLVNFCRPFIYTTALPAAAVGAIRASYALFPGMEQERAYLRGLIDDFRLASKGWTTIDSETPIQALIIPGNERVKNAAAQLQEKGFDIRPILYPTVPEGQERLRIVLHTFNTSEEISRAVEMLNLFYF
ncbi:MAG: 8-amino-7-oxononanoate synthase [Flavitalea sp.]